MLPLTAKAERALAYHLQHAADGLHGWTVYTARGGADPPAPPHLLIVTIDAGLPEDLPPSVGTLSLTIDLRATDTAEDGDTSPRLRQLLFELQASLGDLTALQARLNSPGAGLPDPRPFAPFHLTDLTFTADPILTVQEDSQHRGTLTVTILATDANG